MFPDLPEGRFSAVRNQESQQPGTGAAGAESWASPPMGKILTARLSWWRVPVQEQSSPSTSQSALAALVAQGLPRTGVISSGFNIL